MILVTGGTGFVGRHLVARFVADGRRVRVLSRTPGRVPLPDGVSWTQGDLTGPESLREALRGVSIIVHAGAVLGDAGHPVGALERVNVGGTRALARAAREAGVRRFVHVSSAGVYGDGATEAPHRETEVPAPLSPYEASKLAAERALAQALEGSGVRWCVLRPQGLYGPDRPATQAFFRSVARRWLWLHGPARVVVHPTYIGDLVAAVRRVLEHDGLEAEVINIGGARALEFRELIALVGACVGHTPLQASAPRWAGPLAGTTLAACAACGWRPAMLARLSRAWINRAVSIEKARRLLGFEPLALHTGLERTAAELARRGLL